MFVPSSFSSEVITDIKITNIFGIIKNTLSNWLYVNGYATYIIDEFTLSNNNSQGIRKYIGIMISMNMIIISCVLREVRLKL